MEVVFLRKFSKDLDKIKKPKDLIKTIKNQSTLDKVWNSQHSMIKTPNGRLNANTVILKVF